MTALREAARYFAASYPHMGCVRPTTLNRTYVTETGREKLLLMRSVEATLLGARVIGAQGM